MLNLDQIKKQLEEIAPLPWTTRYAPATESSASSLIITGPTIDEGGTGKHFFICELYNTSDDGITTLCNANFITSAPSTIASLVQEVERERACFLAMHQKYHEAQVKLKDVEQENLKLLKTIDSLKLELEGR